jgi:enoyl-CoA hydratase/carnithine racemase
MTEVLTSRREASRLVLTIDRPERRNALNGEVVDGLRKALAGAAAEPDVRVVVLTGAGDEAFCAGADLAGKSFEFDYAMPTTGYSELLRAAQALRVPLVARVNGACMAGGMGLLAMCDLAIASPRAVFGLPEVKIGLFPMQVLAVLQGLVPQRVLARLCMTGRPLDAQAALQAGLVNEVAEDLDGAMERLLGDLMSASPSALRRGLYAMKAMRPMSFEQAIAFAEGQIGLMALTEDAREGLASFTEKRKPQWSGR